MLPRGAVHASRGVHASGGVCMVPGGGGMLPGGHAWLWGGNVWLGGMHFGGACVVAGGWGHAWDTTRYGQ